MTDACFIAQSKWLCGLTLLLQRRLVTPRNNHKNWKCKETIAKLILCYIFIDLE